MELRSAGNPDTSNPVTMSMLEYLSRKGVEAMSGTCKYPESVCPHMTVLGGKSYCNATPCQFAGEFPKQSNADRIRGMGDEELAKFLSDFTVCKICEHYNKEFDRCDSIPICVTKYAEVIVGDWLKQPVED